MCMRVWFSDVYVCVRLWCYQWRLEARGQCWESGCVWGLRKPCPVFPMELQTRRLLLQLLASGYDPLDSTVLRFVCNTDIYSDNPTCLLSTKFRCLTTVTPLWNSLMLEYKLFCRNNIIVVHKCVQNKVADLDRKWDAQAPGMEAVPWGKSEPCIAVPHHYCCSTASHWKTRANG